jgi:hypothetical protein
MSEEGLVGPQSSSGHYTGNYLPAVPAIDAEIGIGGENDRIRKSFRHTHKAGVGETHGQLYVFLQEFEYRL